MHLAYWILRRRIHKAQPWRAREHRWRFRCGDRWTTLGGEVTEVRCIKRTGHKPKHRSPFGMEW